MLHECPAKPLGLLQTSALLLVVSPLMASSPTGNIAPAASEPLVSLAPDRGFRIGSVTEFFLLQRGQN